MNYSKGFDLEERLKGYLKGQQYEVEVDRTLDHDYKIDFVIRRFPNNPKLHSLGVQVTLQLRDIRKLQEFVAVNSKEYRVVDKVVYLEMDPNLDFEKGVGHLVSVGLSEFQFNAQHLNEKMLGLRINGDMTYTVFNIAETLSILAAEEMKARAATSTQEAAERKTSTPVTSQKSENPVDIASAVRDINCILKGVPKPSPRRKPQGFINCYFRNRDYGFITAQTGETYFFGLVGVADGQLRDKLLALPSLDWAATVDGTVEFDVVGKARPDAKYAEVKGLFMVNN